MKQVHFKQYSKFIPNLNPFEMAVLGIKGGKLFNSEAYAPPKFLEKVRQTKGFNVDRYISPEPSKDINHYSGDFSAIEEEFKIINSNSSLTHKFDYERFFAWYANLYYFKIYQLDDKHIIEGWAEVRASLLNEHHYHKNHDEGVIKQCLLEIGVHYEQ